MRIEPCAFAGWQEAGAPQVRQVLGLAVDRSQARLQARAALRACLAPELDCVEGELHISNLRNQAPRVLLRGEPLAALHCSISHAPGLALLAWHGQGPVGVDIQALDGTVPRRELADVARLYLEPNTVEMLMVTARDAHFFEAFAAAWTQHEARLKCAGLGLAEWSGALQARLAGMRCEAVRLGGEHAGALAWRG